MKHMLVKRRFSYPTLASSIMRGTFLVAYILLLYSENISDIKLVIVRLLKVIGKNTIHYYIGIKKIVTINLMRQRYDSKLHSWTRKRNLILY